MKTFLLFLSLSLLSVFAFAEDNGILRKASPHSVETTRQRFEEAIQEKGMKVFPSFDHAAAAREYDKTMKPTVVVSFGNPRYGTPIMTKNPESGIDFPPKAIIYEDQKGQVWLAYNSASYLYETIFQRHEIDYKNSEIESYETVLEEITDYAVAAE